MSIAFQAILPFDASIFADFVHHINSNPEILVIKNAADYIDTSRASHKDDDVTSRHHHVESYKHYRPETAVSTGQLGMSDG